MCTHPQGCCPATHSPLCYEDRGCCSELSGKKNKTTTIGSDFLLASSVLLSTAENGESVGCPRVVPPSCFSRGLVVCRIRTGRVVALAVFTFKRWRGRWGGEFRGIVLFAIVIKSILTTLCSMKFCPFLRDKKCI